MGRKNRESKLQTEKLLGVNAVSQVRNGEGSDQGVVSHIRESYLMYFEGTPSTEPLVGTDVECEINRRIKDDSQVFWPDHLGFS